jgi:nitrous oxide reductase accessory protein NosL
MDNELSRVDRRRVLETLGSGAALALAGCAGNGDSETPTEDAGDARLDEPTAFPDGEECAVCNMITAEHPKWNAQLVHEGGTRVYFCSSGCMAGYRVAPDEFGGPDASIAATWVTGHETRELIDASRAFFVRVTDSDHVDDVMMMNPVPFADRDDAEAFVASFDAYDEDDIIRLESFDRDLALQYRGRFFEDDNGNATTAE